MSDKKSAAAVSRPDFHTEWETDDGEIDVSLSCGAKREADVTVVVGNESFPIATSIGDIDEMIDILIRCRVSAVRYRAGAALPSDACPAIKTILKQIKECK